MHLRKILSVTTPVQAGTENTPVVTLAVEGDAVKLRGGKCDQAVPLAPARR